MQALHYSVVPLLAVLVGTFCPAHAQTSGIAKVVKLLEEMKAQIEKEGKEDTEAYEEYSCWCDTNLKEKTAAVEAAEKEIAELEAFLEQATGLMAELKSEIAGLEEDIAEDQTSLEKATGVRAEEAAAFAVEEADLKECLAVLQEAVKVLAKVQLLQHQRGKHSREAIRPLLLQLRNIVDSSGDKFGKFRGVMQQDLFDVLGSFGTNSAIDGFLMPKDLSALSQGQQVSRQPTGAAAGAKSYNAGSGKILGILKQMEEEFSKNLSGVQKAELEAMVMFEKLRAAKIAEIAAASKQKEEKEAAIADLEQKVANAKDDLAATQDALSADEKFLVNLGKTCKTSDEEYAVRSKSRAEEIRAISEALAILTSDESRDLFSKTSALPMQSSAAMPRSRPPSSA